MAIGRLASIATLATFTLSRTAVHSSGLSANHSMRGVSVAAGSEHGKALLPEDGLRPFALQVGDEIRGVGIA